MFEPMSGPRIFGVPPGADFPKELVDHLLNYFRTKPVEELARVTILVNTRRMQRRLRELFAQSGPLLLPRISLVTEFDALMKGALPDAVTPLRRRLEMTRLVAQRIATDGHAPKSAAVDLAESLTNLLDELHGESVDPVRFSELKVEDESGYWERSLAFLNIVNAYVDAVSDRGVDGEARRRAAANLMIAKWKLSPPQDPIVIAGSTGSRGTTSLLMEAVARLPKGAIFLPGFDFDLPGEVWHQMASSRILEDHPQFRFAAFLAKIEATHSDVIKLGRAPAPVRNKLISLSLRPAKVTDQWLGEGPQFDDLRNITSDIALIEAGQPREEALAIAVALKTVIHEGKKAALITPDGTLGRRVVATLARWNIRPDESAGVPLSLTPPGRFLRQIADLIGQPARPDALLALLKHPLCRTGSGDRGPHILNALALEVVCRENYIASVDAEALDLLGKDAGEERKAWCDWLSALLERLAQMPNATLEEGLAHHITLAEDFASGTSDGSGALWDKDDGEDVRTEVDRFRAESDFSAPIRFVEYARLIERALMAENSRPQEGVRPDVMIWGTLEARVQGADVVVLGGLNEGIWPEQPAPDPWLSRTMRRELGLLLPERQIGLSAHDYQQAIGAPEVILSRAKRNEDSETVPSRWLNRLTNLLQGLTGNNGPQALEAMQERGMRFVEIARTLDPPLLAPPARRPAPAPPVSVRPRRLSVTAIRKLIQDPYAIYAERVLKLKALSPLVPQPDARLKGIVFHALMEEIFYPNAIPVTHARIEQSAQRLLEMHVPWPHVRAHWLGHVRHISEQLMTFQKSWSGNEILAVEAKGVFGVPGTTFNVTAKADRLDNLPDGSLMIYDYKTGSIPKHKDIVRFDRQLVIESLMAEAGAFECVPPAPVADAVHVGIGRSPKEAPIDLQKHYNLVTVSDELAALLTEYDNPNRGYISRRIMEDERFAGDYDHMARFGEWDATHATAVEQVS
ncbi:MAG: double-strand break repair protein AddB [Paracoccaceae bacterium]